MAQGDRIGEITDSDLVDSVRGGAVEAFDMLVHRYRRDVYRLAFAMTQDHAAADDLAQETFVQAYRSIRQLRDGQSFGSWLRRVLFTFCLKHNRLRKPVSLDGNADNEPSRSDGPALAAEKSLLRQQVRETIVELEPHERAVVLLYYMDGFKQTEIADILNCPVGTVWSRLSSAREKMRTRLAGAVAETEDGDGVG